MQLVQIPNNIPGINLYEVEAGLGKTYTVIVNEELKSKLFYFKCNPEKEEYFIPVTKIQETQQRAIVLEYPIDIQLRKIMADITILGGKFANFKMIEGNGDVFSKDRYSLILYLNSNYNKHIF